MSLNGLWQIILARRNFIAMCVICCLVGVVVVSLIVPPIWEGQSRVLLNLVKPDPVTNELAAGSSGSSTGAYVGTQMSLMTDYSVTGKVVDQLGWLSDPNLIQQYNDRDPGDRREFRAWAGDIIARNTKVKPLKDSTILEISYTANNPTAAKAVADALRTAYMQASLAISTEDAARTAQWYEGELEKLKAKLDAAVEAQALYERANGLEMANDKMDVESARLQSLASQGAPMMIPPEMVNAAKQSGMELAAVNAQITAASKTLGPNNPAMMELQKKKTELESLARKDESAAHAAIAATGAAAAEVNREIQAQKSKVLGKSDQIAHLQTLQQDVDLRRNEYETAAAKFAVYRAQADQTNANTLTALPTPAPSQPLFPNWLLEIPGSIVLGLGIGVLGAMLLELLNRKVRSVEELDDVLQLPVVGVVGAPRTASSDRQRRGVRTARTPARAARA
jgi:polysaccharide biosynthesis transport protein